MSWLFPNPNDDGTAKAICDLAEAKRDEVEVMERALALLEIERVKREIDAIDWNTVGCNYKYRKLRSRLEALTDS